jgi:spore germination cell wall hydrolase CwlJ-like protein
MKHTMSFILTAATVFSIGTVAYDEVRKAQENIECLALNVYHEARGESEEGQIAVANVTMNRVEHSYFPDDVCSVVWDDNQFSWTHDGRSDKAENEEAYELAKKIAFHTYFYRDVDNTNGALFYHTLSVDPSWNDHESLSVSVELGEHVFYNWSGTWN